MARMTKAKEKKLAKDIVDEQLRPAIKKFLLASKRTRPDWFYCQPDDRNRLLEEAREIVAAYLYCAKHGEAEYKSIDKAARRWLKETKP